MRLELMARGSLAITWSLLATAAATAQTIDPTDPVGAPGLPGLGPLPCERIALCNTGVSLTNGEAYAGNGRLWQTDFNGGQLRLVDTKNDCNVLATCPIPPGSPSENAYDGEFVYHYNFATGLIYQIDPDTCAIVSSCDAPGDDFAEGLTYDGEFFWKGDSTTLYKFTYAAGNCQIVDSCPNPPGEAADGLAMCGNLLNMLAYSGIIYQIDPVTCDVVGACQLNVGAAGNGVASDGVSDLFVDQPDFIDVVNVDCGGELRGTPDRLPRRHRGRCLLARLLHGDGQRPGRRPAGDARGLRATAGGHDDARPAGGRQPGELRLRLDQRRPRCVRRDLHGDRRRRATAVEQLRRDDHRRARRDRPPPTAGRASPTRRASRAACTPPVARSPPTRT